LVFDAASGQWHQIKSTAENIHNSYILKQKLSAEQRHQLHAALPQEFQTLDGQFHQYAAMLAHAAEEKNTELVHFYIYKMSESCSACHSQFAAQRFQGFQSHESAHHH